MATARITGNVELKKLLESLRQQLDGADPAQPAWLVPGTDWPGGGLDDYDAVAAPFDRTRINQLVATAISDPKNPGHVVDTIVGPLQVDALASLERAFRQLHCYPWHRSLLLDQGRLDAHAHPQGPLETALSRFLENYLKHAGGEKQA